MTIELVKVMQHRSLDLKHFKFTLVKHFFFITGQELTLETLVISLANCPSGISSDSDRVL